MRPNNKCFTSTGQCEELLPRLPDEITLDRIVPKLPWKTFHMLATVSQAWRKAIGDHRVHDARIHSCSTDTLVVHGHYYGRDVYALNGVMGVSAINGVHDRIAVYSVRDKRCYDLPPIPGHGRGIPFSFQCISLDGKIYVLGGVHPSWEGKQICTISSSSKVYVLDLAGASHWKECASMEEGRRRFGCTILDGKIYVCGGTNAIFEPVLGAEVYNPKINARSPIVPMTSLQSMRFDHRVSTVKQKIFVHGGEYYHPSYSPNELSDSSGIYRIYDTFTEAATFVDVYDPVKETWTGDKSLGKFDTNFFETGCLVVAREKFHAVYPGGISVHNGDGSWTDLSEHTFACSDPRMAAYRVFAVVVNDELFARVEWADRWSGNPTGKFKSSSIFQSQGFGTQSSRVVWSVVAGCPGALDFMHCIQI